MKAKVSRIMKKEINAFLLLEYPTQSQWLPSYYTSHYCTEETANAALKNFPVNNQHKFQPNPHPQFISFGQSLTFPKPHPAMSKLQPTKWFLPRTHTFKLHPLNFRRPA
jgi:hypothetical protein